MEKKQFNRQIAMTALLLALLLAFLGLLVWKLTADWRAQRHLDKLPMELQPTATHSQADLEAAAEAVTQQMSIDWKFDLERIRYDPAQAGPLSPPPHNKPAPSPRGSRFLCVLTGFP